MCSEVLISACRSVCEKEKGTAGSLHELPQPCPVRTAGPGQQPGQRVCPLELSLPFTRGLLVGRSQAGRSQARAQSPDCTRSFPEGGSCSLPQRSLQRTFLICCWQRDKQHSGHANCGERPNGNHRPHCKVVGKRALACLSFYVAKTRAAAFIRPEQDEKDRGSMAEDST